MSSFGPLGKEAEVQGLLRLIRKVTSYIIYELHLQGPQKHERHGQIDHPFVYWHEVQQKNKKRKMLSMRLELMAFALQDISVRKY